MGRQLPIFIHHPQRQLLEVHYARHVPTIWDRVVQTAAKLVLEPIFEADFEDGAYGYRPGRSAVGAIKEVHRLICRGYTDVVDADLSKYLDTASYCPLVHEP
jgi:RNA-directed DNA polymerase